MNRPSEFTLSALALLAFVTGALTLIGAERYIEDRDNHRNMQETK